MFLCCEIRGQRRGSSTDPEETAISQCLAGISHLAATVFLIQDLRIMKLLTFQFDHFARNFLDGFYHKVTNTDRLLSSTKRT